MTRKEATEMLKALNMMLRNSDGEPIDADFCSWGERENGAE